MSSDIQLVDQFSDKRWRLSNLYYILDESNREVKFAPNEIQLDFWNKMWYLNNILKGRQHGFTTFIDLFILDECLWHPNQVAGIIAHTLDDVRKIFRRKIKHPYDRLDPGIKSVISATNDSAQELVFSNNSEISVATTMRAGTLNFLHVSEFGYIAAYYPEKAEEIVTGSFNTVHTGNYIFVESTGHGKGGKFYELCERSRKHQQAGKPLTMLDFRYHFYPWWVNAKYRLSDEDAKMVVFTKEQSEYFARVEKATGAKLEFSQRAWYVKKKEWNGELMLREYPSTDSEPFEASIKGAIFAEYMGKARSDRRITSVPYEPGLPVDTWWDIGRRDATAIWFVQTLGREVRFIYFFEDVLKGLPYYLKKLDELRRDKGFQYRHHVGPNDFGVTEYGSDKTRFETARNLGYTFIVSRQFSEQDQIDAARNLIGYAYFDEANCDAGIAHLDQFRYEWNEHLQQYMNTYRHDEHSHASSALMTGAMMLGFMQRGRARALPVKNVNFAT
jgi:hypothetical protein